MMVSFGLGVVLLSGCAALLIGGGAAMGAGSVMWIRGELRVVEGVGLDALWNASQAAMKDLQLAVVKQEKDALQARLKARGSGDKKIVLKLKNKGERLTELRIRVGFFGDKTLSQGVLDAIRKHSGGAPASKP